MSDQDAGKRLTLLGGPSSGKSTYLGALIDALEDGEPYTGTGERASNLELAAGPPDDAHAWEHLTEPILAGEYPQRTQAGRRLDIDVGLRMTPRVPADAAPVDFSLRVGDYDGEDVERLFRDRTRGWSDAWRARASADGLLLFLRPDAIRQLPRPQSHVAQLSEHQRWQHLAGITPPPAPPIRATVTGPEAFFAPGLAPQEIPAPPPARPGDPVHIPTVLALIELVQFVRHVRGLAPGERPAPGNLRVAVMVAAWDAADPAWGERGAAAYIGETLPLLVDFLWSNFHQSDFLCFGVSATGGDLEDARHRERFQGREPDALGYVTWADSAGVLQRRQDLSIPLQWALFGDTVLTTSPDVGA